MPELAEPVKPGRWLLRCCCFSGTSSCLLAREGGKERASGGLSATCLSEVVAGRNLRRRWVAAGPELLTPCRIIDDQKSWHPSAKGSRTCQLPGAGRADALRCVAAAQTANTSMCAVQMQLER